MCSYTIRVLCINTMRKTKSFELLQNISELTDIQWEIISKGSARLFHWWHKIPCNITNDDEGKSVAACSQQKYTPHPPPPPVCNHVIRLRKKCKFHNLWPDLSEGGKISSRLKTIFYIWNNSYIAITSKVTTISTWTVKGRDEGLFLNHV